MFTQPYFTSLMSLFNPKLTFLKVNKQEEFTSLIYKYDSSVSLEIKMWKDDYSISYELYVIWASMLSSSISDTELRGIVFQLPTLIQTGNTLLTDFDNNQTIKNSLDSIKQFYFEVLQWKQ